MDPNDSQSLAKTFNHSDRTQGNRENSEFKNTCRICATVTEFVIPIFQEEGTQNNLEEKIHKHLPIQVSENDGLPHVVCYQCTSTLLAWHELVECCVQAEMSFRTQIAVSAAKSAAESVSIAQAETPSTSTEGHIALQPVAVKEDVDQNKFGEFAVEPPPLPPPSAPPREPKAAAALVCVHCGARHADEATYQQHLVATHLDLLFHCEECDQYIRRQDLILHMAEHYLQYGINDGIKTVKPEKKDKKVKIKKSIDVDAGRSDDTIENGAAVDSEQEQKHKPVVEESVTSKAAKEPNDFSDHSDSEYGFGPLPESVFEAIEDSQDNLPCEDRPARADAVATNPSPKKTKSKKTFKSRACPICHKVYNVSSSYFYHVKYSHVAGAGGGVRRHACATCGRAFPTRGALRQHADTHAGELNYECHICQKKFRSKGCLYVHTESHTKTKKWACNQCPQSFSWRQLLVKHMKRHSAKKDYVCTTCKRGFKVRSDLVRHMRTHNAETHRCDKCQAKFSQLRYLKVHVLKKHTATPTNEENTVLSIRDKLTQVTRSCDGNT